jgi:hypothetical protein
MNYLNRFKQLSDEAADALYSLVKDMINKNTTNILEVGTYAGQATLRIAGAAQEKSTLVRVISIDQNSDAFSPSAEESLRASNLFNCSFESDRLKERFEENIVKASIIYIDRFHSEIESKMELIKKNALVPTKVIYRNPKASSDFPFEITEVSPQVKPRARKKTTEDTKDAAVAATKVSAKETKKETT